MTDEPQFEHSDGSTPPVDIVENPGRRLGPHDGTAAFRGLMAKRAARRRGGTAPQADPVDGQAPDGTDTPEGDSEAVPGDVPPTTTDTESDPTEGDGSEADDQGYDPGAHTVTDVAKYLEDHPDQSTYVLNRERTGKARTTLIGA